MDRAPWYAPAYVAVRLLQYSDPCTLAFDWHHSSVQRWCLEACKAKALEIMSAAETVHPDALTRVVRHHEQCMQLAAAAAASLLSLEG